MMSTVPSRAWAIRRTSATCQSTPTPRQSHWNLPVTLAMALLSCCGVSLWFSPSVSRIACFWASIGTESNSRPARISQVPIAVPPSERNWAIAWWAAKRALGSIRTMPAPWRTGGKARYAWWVPATTAK